jgi:hypothetical protein
MPNMRSVALIDFHTEGHHRTYILAYTRALLESGFVVKVLYPLPELFVDLQKTYSAQLVVRPIKGIDLEHKSLGIALVYKIAHTLRPALANRWIAWLLWRRAVRARPTADVVFFMAVDAVLAAPLPQIAQKFFVPWTGLCINLKKKGHFTLDWQKIGLAQTASCRSIAILDETAADELTRLINKPVVVFPDVTDESRTLDTVLRDTITKKAKGRKVVLAPGAIASRKGVMPLIRCIKKASNSRDYLFVIAGKIHEKTFEPDELAELQAFFAAPPENVLILQGRIEDGSQFNTLFQSADVIYAAYIGFANSSNTLTKAALFEKPLVVAKNTLMGQRVEAFNLGVTVASLHSDELLGAFKTVLSDTRPRRFKEYFSLHSCAKLKETLANVLKTGSK